MIPLRDDKPTELTPVVTLTFIALNVAAWVLLQDAGNPERLQASVWEYGTVPCELTQACVRENGLGWVELLTSMFMHGGWLHILGNMLCLWVFGNNVEDSMGHTRFILFYLICGVAAGLAHVFFYPASEIPAVGASGAIGGIMGGYVLLYPQARVLTWVPPIFFINIRAWFFLIYWFMLQLLAGVGSLGGGDSGGVAVWAHIGGFVAGLLLIKPFENRKLVYAKTHGIVLPPQEVARDEWKL